MRVNIDEYAIAGIRRCTSIKPNNKGRQTFHFEFEKYAIVNLKAKYVEGGLYRKCVVDALTKEKYYLGAEYIDEVNTLYINPKIKFVPLSYIIKSKNNKIRKSEFFKICRECIINLNEKELDEDQKNIINKANGKEKVLRLKNSKVLYEEEEE